jgi:hypothetical protein
MTTIFERLVLAFLAVGLAGAIAGCDDDKKKKQADAGADAAMDGGDTDQDGGVSESGISIGNPAVRSCDVLLEEAAGTRVVDVAFTDDVVGRTKQRSPKVSVSFFAKDDAAMTSGVVEISVGAADGHPGATLDAPTVSQAVCYDREGKKVDEPELAL